FVPAGLVAVTPARVLVADGKGQHLVDYRMTGKGWQQKTSYTLPRTAAGAPVILGAQAYVPVDKGVAVVPLGGSAAASLVSLETTPAALAASPATHSVLAALPNSKAVYAIAAAREHMARKLDVAVHRPTAVATARGGRTFLVYDAASHTLLQFA